LPLELTPEGKRAYAILAAAQADHGRIGGAQQQIGDLALQVTNGSQALREVQDAGTILHRLAGVARPVTISGQVAGRLRAGSARNPARGLPAARQEPSRSSRR